ncbi:helix-turn-helix domain-containing protein [Nitrospira sp. Ecomares 2.1]
MRSIIHNKLSQKFKDKAYFNKFFRQRVQDEIALGMQNLREERELKQNDLAILCGMKQSAISRIENADYASWNFKTLSRVAEALDARLKIEFETREDVIKQYQSKSFAEISEKKSDNTEAKHSFFFNKGTTQNFPGSKGLVDSSKTIKSNTNRINSFRSVEILKPHKYIATSSSPGGTA